MIVKQYKCKKCSSIFDITTKNMTEKTAVTVKCPHCGSKKTHRTFKMGGFAVTAGNCGNAKNGYSNKN